MVYNQQLVVQFLKTWEYFCSGFSKKSKRDLTSFSCKILSKSNYILPTWTPLSEGGIFILVSKRNLRGWEKEPFSDFT